MDPIKGFKLPFFKTREGRNTLLAMGVTALGYMYTMNQLPKLGKAGLDIGNDPVFKVMVWPENMVDFVTGSVTAGAAAVYGGMAAYAVLAQWLLTQKGMAKTAGVLLMYGSFVMAAATIYTTARVTMAGV